MPAVALDCEMVGSGNRSLLASVSIVDENCGTLFHEYVKPTAPVTDYRSFVNEDMRRLTANGQSFEYVKGQVQKLLAGKILVGHSLHFDLAALGLQHPERDMRDLAKCPLYLKNGQPQSLKDLARIYLYQNIQQGGHDSLEDARAAMMLYKRVQYQW